MAAVLTRLADPLAERAAKLLVERGVLDEAARERLGEQARNWRMRLGAVVLASTGVTGLAWARALAEAAGRPLADLARDPPDPALLTPALRADYVRLGALPWRREADGTVTIAATDPDDPALEAWIGQHFAAERTQLVVTARFDILWAVQRAFDAVASLEAREALFAANPELSAKTTFSIGQLMAVWVLGSAVLAGLWAAPDTTLVVLTALITMVYTQMFVFRFILTWVGADRRVDVAVTEAELAALDDADLPVFTVLVPMYREAGVLPLLVDGMRRLDYPRAKLDVKLVLEENDSETIDAAKALGAESIFEIVRVPDSQPKTKPKACNYALRFARGEYTVIFDAEDVPERDQLKKVVATFRRSPPEVACVQARLNYFNRDDNFLTRMFTLEYSQWFDYLLPGLHALQIPIPLGGTSNHFRTETLLALGAWDPYNVTEDADLGVRLTQAGYRVAVVNSTTFEEANGVLGSWINQRSRWIKGYMQTWLVHMRHPLDLYRRLGTLGFWGFQMFIGFPALTALINPLLWLVTVYGVWSGSGVISHLFPGAVLYLAMFNLLVANGMYLYFGCLAATKRGWYGLVPWGLLAPAYWLLHSVAAYKALRQLIFNPHYWEKTQHGTSAATRSVLATLGAGAAPHAAG